MPETAKPESAKPDQAKDIVVTRLDAGGAAARRDALVDILCDAVDGGASVSFLPPMDRDAARRFWDDAIRAVTEGSRILLVAEDAAGPVGTVQLEPVWKPNQPHRCEVTKLLVHRRARRRGIARMLMRAIEDEARAIGRTLITLDTQTGGAAEPLYRAIGYVELGVIPRFALNGAGGLDGTTIFYKEL